MRDRIGSSYAIGGRSVSVRRRIAGIGVARGAALGKQARDWTRGDPVSFKDPAALTVLAGR